MYIKHLSEICEVKAIAYKDLHDSLKGKPRQNNLYVVWQQKFHKDKNHFLKWVNEYCESKIIEYKIRESEFYDSKLYEGILQTIESYYASVP